MTAQRTKSKEKPVTDSKTNIGSTYEKCPKMSQLMLDKGGPLQNQTEKSMINQLKEAQIGVFSKHEMNSSVHKMTQTRKIKRKKGPQYRQIDAYWKSREQYKKERQRRKRVRELSAEGFTYRQIAKRLGISEKTVYRDMKKVWPYILGQVRRKWRQFDQERQREFQEGMDGLSLMERFKVLSEALHRRMDAMKAMDNYHGHYTIFLLDLTETDKYGIPKLTQLPHQTRGQPLMYPYKIRVVVKGRYEGRTFEAEIGGFNIIQTTRW